MGGADAPGHPANAERPGGAKIPVNRCSNGGVAQQGQLTATPGQELAGLSRSNGRLQQYPRRGNQRGMVVRRKKRQRSDLACSRTVGSPLITVLVLEWPPRVESRVCNWTGTSRAVGNWSHFVEAEEAGQKAQGVGPGVGPTIQAERIGNRIGDNALTPVVCYVPRINHSTMAPSRDVSWTRDNSGFYAGRTHSGVAAAGPVRVHWAPVAYGLLVNTSRGRRARSSHAGECTGPASPQAP